LGDPLRLRQVLQNLIENAIKYRSPERSPIIEIGTIVRDDMKEKPILFVRDNGKGIPLEYQDKIFDLFHKVDSKSDGSGVGLALVKRIIEVHNGHIWVESEAGKGSTFYFTLPPSG
jgi:signal transduction histidine kinase